MKKLPIASGLILPLSIATLLFNEYCQKRFFPIFQGYPVEVRWSKFNANLSHSFLDDDFCMFFIFPYFHLYVSLSTSPYLIARLWLLKFKYEWLVSHSSKLYSEWLTVLSNYCNMLMKHMMIFSWAFFFCFFYFLPFPILSFIL